MRAIHQIMPALVYGDAIGNHAVEIWKLLRSRGIRSTIYAKHIDPRYAHAARDFRQYQDQPGNLLIYHFSIGSDVSRFVKSLSHSQVAIYYHNITPARFFEDVNPLFAQELANGRQDLLAFHERPWAIAASEYNRIELLAAGFSDVSVVPYLIDVERLKVSTQTAQAKRICAKYANRRFTLLFVGRIAPNKCQHDLIHLLNYYRQLIDPDARLLLVGSDAVAGAYRARLLSLIQRFGLEDSVELVGPVGTDDGLGVFYQLADAFVCMSEHEGFCVPIVESMYFGLPVFAFRSTGVPYTMGDAGVMFTQKRFDALAEVIAHFHFDPALRERVICGQKQRLQAFDLEETKQKLLKVLDEWKQA
jgi:glycosyltransferase involved in cell wall biosynthesis